MVDFQPPIIHRLLPFLIPILYCHCLAYQNAKAIVKHESYYPTLKYLPITTVAEIVSLVLGAILFELFTKKFLFILYLQIIWFTVLLLYYTAAIYLSGPTFRILLAFIYSTLKITIIAYGASEYKSRSSSELYVYFWFCYGAMIFSDLSFVNLGCAVHDYIAESKVAIISVLCGLFAVCYFFVSTSIYTVPIAAAAASDSGMNFRSVFRCIMQCGKLIIFIAAMTLLWIGHYQILLHWNLVSEIMPMNNISYSFGPENVRMVYVLCSALFGVIFYVGCYAKFEKFMITQPIYVVIFGCLLMSLTVPSIMKLEEARQSYESKQHSKNISWLIFCATNTATTVYGTSNVTGNFVIENKRCKLFKYMMDKPEEIIEYKSTLSITNTTTTSFSQSIKQQFLRDCGFINCLLDMGGPVSYNVMNYSHVFEYKLCNPYILYGPIVRNKTLMATVCSTCSYASAMYDRHIYVLFKIAQVEQKNVEDLSYRFECKWYPTTSETNCQSLVPGVYGVRDLLSTSNSTSVIKLGKGGFYYLKTSLYMGESDFEIFTLIKPIEEIPFPLLWPSILLMSIAHYIILVSGLYYVYTQSHPKLKTISLGIWMCCTLSGDLEYYIFDVASKSVHKLEITVYIFIGTAVVIQILKLFILDFDNEWKSTQDSDGLENNEIISKDA